MTDFKETDGWSGQKRMPEPEIGTGKHSDTNSSGFLDEDLDEDFIREEDAEAFLNEIDFSEKEITFAADRKKLIRKDADKSAIEEKLPVKNKVVKKAEFIDNKEEALKSETLNSETPEPDAPSAEPTELESQKFEPAKHGLAEQLNEAQPDIPEKRPGRGKRIAAITAGLAAMLVLACGGVYFLMGNKYNKVFFPNTQINGVDASGKSVEEVKSLISSGIDGYMLTIAARGDKTELITRADINLRAEFDGSLEKLLGAQEPLEWLKYQMNPSSYQIKTMVAYDEQLLEDKINGLDCMNISLMVQPQDARISDYTPGLGYTVIPEIPGTAVNEETVRGAVREAVTSLEKTVSLEEMGAYKAVGVTKEDASLLTLCGELNKYTAVTVTYRFGDVTEVLSGDRIKEWLTVNEDRTLTINPELVAGYIEELSIAYDTYNKAKTLNTSYGPSIEIRGGHYGWRINRGEEAAALIDIIKSGESVEREPVYSQKAAGRGGNDYGNTYVEINLTAQHLFFYKDGSLLVESDFVSGNTSRGWTTPPGTFPLTYKQRNATLKGENYRTPVDYWMPFNGGIGMHDAKWRTSFGGNIYKTGGSHGCINLPHSVAKLIYENISAGMPVLCYNLAGTESAGSSQTTPPPAPTVAPTQAPPQEQIPETPPQTLPQTPEPQPTLPPETLPVPETTAPAGPGSDTGIDGPVGPGSV